MYRILLAILLLLFGFQMTAFAFDKDPAPKDPGDDCFEAAPFCSTEDYYFPNLTDLTAPDGPDYGCLNSTPNPVWYYLKIDQGGVIELEIEQQNSNNSGLDVDFAMWGPFDDLDAGCTEIMSGNLSPLQCSYSASYTEQIGIGTSGGSNDISGFGASTPPPAQPGEYYMVLLTNYSNNSGGIGLTQSNEGEPGAGSTDCSVVEACNIGNVTASAGSCDPSTNTTSISGTVTFIGEPGFGNLVIEDCNGNSVSYPVGQISSPWSYEIENITPAGGICNVTAYFSDDSNCSATSSNFQLPTDCGCEDPPTPSVSTGNATCGSDGTASISNYTAYDNDAEFVFNPSGPTVGSNGEINNLNPGTNYTVSVKAGGDCESDDVSFSINEKLDSPDAPEIQVSNATCTDDGEATISNYDNSLTYSFNPTGPSINSDGTITGANSGVDYTITVENTDGCEEDNNFVVEEQKDTPDADASAVNSTVCEGEDIELLSNTENGATYSWTGPDGFTSSEQNPTISNPTENNSGTYTLIVDIDGCTSTDEIEITVNPNPEVEIDNIADFCESDGAVELSATPEGGTWSGNGVTGSEFDPAVAGEGSHTVSYEYEDANGCSDNQSITIHVNPTPEYTVSGSDPTECEGEDGYITIAGLEPGEEYEVSYNGNPATTETADNDGNIIVDNLPAGSYSDFEISQGDCPKDSDTQIVLSDPNSPEANASAIETVLCEGEDIELQAATEGNATYSWTGPDGFTSNEQNPTISNPTEDNSGTYSLTVERNGCSSTDEIEITVNPNPEVEIDNIADFCESDGAVELSATPEGGTWYGNGVTGSEFDPAVAGEGSHTISYEYEDANGCSDNQSITINVNPTPEYTVSGSDPTECEGEDGYITIAGLEPGEEYEVSYNGNPATTETADNDGNIIVDNLPAGSYSDFEITLGDCPKDNDTQIVLSDPNSPEANASAVETVLCEGEDIELQAATEGNATYSWTGPNGFTSSEQNPTISSPTEDNSGTYSLTVERNGCSSTDDVEVTVNPLPEIEIDPIADACEIDDIVNLIATPTAGTWSGNGVTGSEFDPADAGEGSHTISYEYEDANGCSDNQSITINVNPTPEYTVSGSDPTECEGEDGYITIAGLEPGEEYEVSYNGNPATTETADNDGNIIVDNLPAGSYSNFEITLGDCPKTDDTEIVLTDPDAPVADASVVNGVICADENIELQADEENDAIYNWTGPNNFTSSEQNPIISDPTEDDSGTYTLTIERDGCFSTDDVEVTVNPLPEVSLASVDPQCQDVALVSLNGSPSGGTYSGPFVSGNQFLAESAYNAQGAGVYSIEYAVTDENNCSNTVIMEIEVVPNPSVTSVTVDVNCDQDNGEIIMDGSGGTEPYTYSVDGGETMQDDNTFTDLSEGNYNTYIEDNYGCVASGEANIDNIEGPESNVSPIMNPSCYGACDGEIHVNPFGGVTPYTYEWTDESGNIVGTSKDVTGLCAGYYEITITDIAGCEVTYNATLENPEQVDASFEFDEFCEGTSNHATNIANSGGVFSFAEPVNDGATIDPTTGEIFNSNGETTYPVEYTVTVDGCTESMVVDVTPISSPEPEFSLNYDNGCAPLTVTFENYSSMNSTDCVWDFGDGTTLEDCGSYISHTFTDEGTYDVSLTTTTVGSGCTGTTTIENLVDVVVQPIADATADPIKVSSSDPEVTFTNQSSGANNYSWDFGDGSPIEYNENVIHNYPEDEGGKYVVTLIASSSENCHDTLRLVITIDEDVVYYIPNTFTPDNNNYNEVFKPIFTSGFDPYNYELLIFNRWGEIIFESHNAEIGWDGTYGNKIAPDGTYIWKIKFKEKKSDEHKDITGHITLVR